MKKFRCVALSVVKHDYVPRAVAAHPRFEIVAVADDANQPAWVHDRNQRFADQLRLPYVRNVEQAIDAYQPDVAIVSSQVERHCDLSIRAVERGLHVVQDKPLSHSLAECDRLVAAIKRRPVQFLMWNRNYLPAVAHARDLIDAGEIGAPQAIHVDFYFAKDAGPAKRSLQRSDTPLDWETHQIAAHATGADGGLGTKPLGELQVEGIYPLAYMRMLVGGEVRRVFARTARHFHQLNVDNDVDDLASVSLEWTDGRVGTLCLGRIGAASHPEIGEIKIHVIGREGSLVISEARPEAAVYYRGQPTEEYPHRRLAVDNDYQQMERFLSAIEKGLPSPLDAFASRAICAVVEAALQSARTGDWVTIPL